MAFIYRIRKIGTDLYSKGGHFPPSFSKNGKTWTSLNTLSTHISGYQSSYEYYKKRFGNGYTGKDPYDGCEIVKLEITESSVKPVSQAFERLRRLKALKNKYGENFAGLVDKLDKDDDNTFLWIVVSKRKTDFNTIIKNMKIKRADHRYVGNAFAFRNKDNAAMFRLALGGESHSIYLPDMDESNGSN